MEWRAREDSNRLALNNNRSDMERRDGAPERIRTSDPCLRRAVLYPAELRALRYQL